MSTACLRALIFAAAFATGLAGCAGDDSGTIDLKKKPDQPAAGGEKPREFRKGDLEER